MTTRICTLGQSIGALQQLRRLLTHKDKLRLFKTQADIAYVDTGLAGAIQQLQWLADNRVMIEAALAAPKAADASRMAGADAKWASEAPSKVERV